MMEQVKSAFASRIYSFRKNNAVTDNMALQSEVCTLKSPIRIRPEMHTEGQLEIGSLASSARSSPHMYSQHRALTRNDGRHNKISWLTTTTTFSGFGMSTQTELAEQKVLFSHPDTR
jgi:hypothetical protein